VKADTPVFPFAAEGTDTFVPKTSSARPPFTLTATLFGALRASLFGARTLPADFCNEPRRTDTNRDSRFLAGTKAMTSFRFLTRHDLLQCANARRSGDARRAALRPFVPTSVPVPPACAGLPDRDTEPTAPPRLFPTAGSHSGSHNRSRASFMATDVHGSLDRAKDVSSIGESAFWASPRRVRALCAC